MDQKSNVKNRAEKEYKNSRDKFYLLLREIISNSFHAVIIRQSKEKDLNGQIKLEIFTEEDNVRIVLTDNGEGFVTNNQKYFDELDARNPEKEAMGFHPLGQGRLAIVYFSDTAQYETVFRNDNGKLKKKFIPYPFESEDLFTLASFNDGDTKEDNSYTKLKLTISSKQKFNRAKAFFNHYTDINQLKNWIIETFFPFIYDNEKLKIEMSLNGERTEISKQILTNNIQQQEFFIKNNPDGDSMKFVLWLISSSNKLKGENAITCFARNLKAELQGCKLTYALDSDNGYCFYLTSDYFDNHVETNGYRIEIPEDLYLPLKDKIKEVLDEVFSKEIGNNKKIAKEHFAFFKNSYPSLSLFSSEDDFMSGSTIPTDEDILKNALDNKGKIEKKFWKNKTSDSNLTYLESEEVQKLVNSSLHIYAKHRERVLDDLHRMIQLFDETGDKKPELENNIHSLFFERGVRLNGSKAVNHLHNLWILDNKYTTFSNKNYALSTKNGQGAADIYIWADDPERTKEILIIELKSTTKAHNPGEMVIQVKGYASDFYMKPTRYLNWDVDTNQVRFNGIIIARKDDVCKEIRANTNSGFEKIPFLESSFYKEDEFQNPKSEDPTNKIKIRIDVYSFEDIYCLAKSRNTVFFKLLNNEFSVNE